LKISTSAKLIKIRHPQAKTPHFDEIDPTTTQVSVDEPQWIEQMTPKEDKILTVDNIPYTHKKRPIPPAGPMTSVSGISVKKSLERRTISAIMDEVKNVLDFKVDHYTRQVDLTYDEEDILRFFMFIK
jgi:hypothetical protein